MTQRARPFLAGLSMTKTRVMIQKLLMAEFDAVNGIRQSAYARADNLALHYTSRYTLIHRRLALVTECYINPWWRDNYNHRMLTAALPLQECLIDVRGWRKRRQSYNSGRPRKDD